MTLRPGLWEGGAGHRGLFVCTQAVVARSHLGFRPTGLGARDEAGPICSITNSTKGVAGFAGRRDFFSDASPCSM